RLLASRPLRGRDGSPEGRAVPLPRGRRSAGGGENAQQPRPDAIVVRLSPGRARGLSKLAADIHPDWRGAQKGGTSSPKQRGRPTTRDQPRKRGAPPP